MDFQNHVGNGITSNGKSSVYQKLDACINEQLPKELLIRVFSYLDITTLCKCSQVCKFWFECAFDGSLWKSINLFQFQRDVNSTVIEKIAERSGGFLRELLLKGCRNVTDDAIEHFTQLCRLIEYLNISGCQNLTNNTCKYLGDNCPELTTLLLDSCPQITDTGIELLNKCSKLTILDVSWCQVSDRGVATIAEGCPSLRRFRAVGCREVTSRGVKELAQRCHSLSLLSLNYCGAGITDEAMVYLATGCPQLKVLAVSHCAITDMGLRALAGSIPATSVAPLLMRASLASPLLLLPAGSPSTSAGDQGAGEPFRPTATNGVDEGPRDDRPGDHRPASPTTPTSPPPAPPAPPSPPPPLGCPELTTLEIARCSAVTDVGLAAVARSCTKLEKLDMEDCGLLTDASLTQLATHCPRLNNLILSHCDQITDEGIAHLAHGLCAMDSLQELAMDNCPLLTDNALEHLGSSCRRLQRVDLYDCQLITKQGISSLESRYQQLRVHAYFAPSTPPASGLERRRRYCRCCHLI